MVAIVFDDPVSKLGRPGGPLASRILIFVTLQRKKKRTKQLKNVFQLKIVQGNIPQDYESSINSIL